MDKKMTSGEIAKKAGVSQKAIRLYDEKGLLKPSEYSEGNYRLYDRDALLVLEKIIALKQIGFSLEEIHDNLIAEKNMDITESLKKQLALMEAKKQELERTIICIKSVLVRTDGQPDWNSVAEIARTIQLDQGADERHFDALKHTADSVDWYVKLYESLGLTANARVLDLGCGYGKLWRNNWTDIPPGVTVDGIDLHGSWADDFEGFIAENKAGLSAGTGIAIQWSDVEDEETWKQLSGNAPYTYVIAHYLLGFLKDPEALIRRAAGVLKESGMFSCNGPEISREHLFWQDAFDELKLNYDYIEKELAQKQEEHRRFGEMLAKYFDRVENIRLSNNMQYDNSEELFERLCSRYPAKKKYFTENEHVLKDYFTKWMEEKGPVTIVMDSEFWHCYK